MAGKPNNITISITQLTVGVIIPADVFDARNVSLLLIRSGVPVTEALLAKLRSRGVQYLMIEESAAAAALSGEAPAAPKRSEPHAATKAAGPAVEKTFRPKTHIPSPGSAIRAAEVNREHSKNLQQVFAAAKRHVAVNGQLARQIVADSVRHIMEDIDVFLKVALHSTESSETYEHCLATAQLAMGVGLVEGLKESAVQDLGVGCMLSRIGQSDAANRFADQMRTLNEVELLDLKRTPFRTFDCLQGMREISLGARSVAFQIFERFNGTGYPRGRAGSDITFLSRIASVCDVYVALTSPRPHRHAFEPYQAIEMLLEETRGGKFDPAAVRGLLRTIGLFPIGSFVQLTDGTVGQIVRNHRDDYDKPIVHLFFDEGGTNIQSSNLTIDLKESADLVISCAMSKGIVETMMFEDISNDADFMDDLGEPAVANALL